MGPPKQKRRDASRLPLLMNGSNIVGINFALKRLGFFLYTVNLAQVESVGTEEIAST